MPKRVLMWKASPSPVTCLFSPHHQLSNTWTGSEATAHVTLFICECWCVVRTPEGGRGCLGKVILKEVKQQLRLGGSWVQGSDRVWVCAGDCRAVLCTAGKAQALSCDHTADREEERRRVQAAGASVQWTIDSWRIGEAGMQVTRYGLATALCPRLLIPWSWLIEDRKPVKLTPCSDIHQFIKEDVTPCSTRSTTVHAFRMTTNADKKT